MTEMDVRELNQETLNKPNEISKAAATLGVSVEEITDAIERVGNKPEKEKTRLKYSQWISRVTQMPLFCSLLPGSMITRTQTNRSMSQAATTFMLS